MPDQDPTQDPLQGLASNPFMQSMTGLQQQPQQAPQDQSQPDQTPTFSVENNGPLDALRGYAKDSQDRLNGFQKENADTMAKLFKTIQYGVEPRANDIAAQLQHRQLIPGQDPDAVGPKQYAPLTTKQKFGNFISEWQRAFREGDNYKPLSERAHARALDDYKAESSVAARDLYNLTYQQRGLQQNALTSVADYQKGAVNYQKANIQQQRADIAAAHQKAIEGMDVFRANQVTERIKLMQAQGRDADAKAYADKMSGAVNENVKNWWATHDYPPNASLQVLLQKHLDDGDIKGADALANQMGLSRGLGAIQSGQVLTNGNGEATGFAVTRGKNINKILAPGTGSNGPELNGQPTPQIPSGAKTTLTPYNTDYSVPQKVQPFPDTKPEDLTIKNLYSYPLPMKVPATVQRKVQSASTLLDRGTEFEALARQIPPKALGTVMGNLNGLITGKWTPDPSLGIAPPVLAQLRTVGHALAVAHMGTQGIGSGQYASELSKDINSWGADIDTMFRGEKGLTSQAYTLLQDNPAIAKQLIARKPGMTGQKFKEIFASTPEDLANQPTNTTIPNTPSPKTKVVRGKDGKLQVAQ